MSRAEEQALKAYPPQMEYSSMVAVSIGNKIDTNEPKRRLFIQGYKQAIKDIWHNVKDEQPIDGERLLLINRNGEYGTVMLMIPILRNEFSKWEKWAYIQDLIPNE